MLYMHSYTLACNSSGCSMTESANPDSRQHC
jgi:hypothetical protein